MVKVVQSVQKKIFIKSTPERVWRALTQADERNAWETRSCEMDIRIGGQVTLDYGWGASYVGTIIELEEEQKLVLQGNDKQLTTWTITSEADGVLVSIEYTGSWAGDIGLMEMDNMLFGTYQFMLNLKSVLEKEVDLRKNFWKSWIGVLHRTVDKREGTKVVQVIASTPADGLLEVDDVITAVNGNTVQCYDDLESYVFSCDPGQNLIISLNRDGQELPVSLHTIGFGHSN